MLKDKKLTCDFCEIEGVGEDDYEKLMDWRGGVRGKIFYVVPVSGYFSEVTKHSCPDKLCQAKLLVWTRT